jgi:hypothetical protein
MKYDFQRSTLITNTDARDRIISWSKAKLINNHAMLRAYEKRWFKMVKGSSTDNMLLLAVSDRLLCSADNDGPLGFKSGISHLVTDWPYLVLDAKTKTLTIDSPSSEWDTANLRKLAGVDCCSLLKFNSLSYAMQGFLENSWISDWRHFLKINSKITILFFSKMEIA